MRAETKTVSTPLRVLLGRPDVSVAAVRRALEAFRCERDEDVTAFLKRRAIQNERTGATRTYLELERTALGAGELLVVAFVSVAVTVTDYAGIDVERRRQVMGNVPGVAKSLNFPGYLLAQLARDDRFSHDDYDCAGLLMDAEDMISGASDIVGGRIVYLDCKDGLLGYYEALGYRTLYFDGASGLYKMIKPLF